MADVQGMLADPDFNRLDPATQRTALSRLDPTFANLSDSDYQAFRQRLAPKVDMSPKNVGVDTQGQGFLPHALQTIRSIPDAVISGGMISGPIQAIGQSMQDYLASPTLHNSIRAIPGVGMAEDFLLSPTEQQQADDISGAWGDATDLAAQLALGLRGAVNEPYRTLEAPAAKTNIPTIPKTAIDATHLVPVKGGAMRLLAKGWNAAAGMFNGAPEEAAAAETPTKPPKPKTKIFPVSVNAREAAPPPGPVIYNIDALRNMRQDTTPLDPNVGFPPPLPSVGGKLKIPGPGGFKNPPARTPVPGSQAYASQIPAPLPRARFNPATGLKSRFRKNCPICQRPQRRRYHQSVYRAARPNQRSLKLLALRA